MKEIVREREKQELEDLKKMIQACDPSRRSYSETIKEKKKQIL